MTKSYKICIVHRFDSSSFEYKPYSLYSQLTMNEVDKPPGTHIWISRDKIEFQDFKAYEIEHEREEEVLCRVGSKSFSKIIRKGKIKAFYGKNSELLYLSGKKADILDFCRKTKKFNTLTISTVSIEMKKLFDKLLSIRLAWFTLPKGLIHAAALMGSSGIERTGEFRKYYDSGDISVLSFPFRVGEVVHQILVTRDGAVVLQQAYDSLAAEVELVTTVKDTLLADIYKEQPVK